MAQGEWSEAEARRVLDAWKRSGLRLQTFAKQRGLTPERLRRWRVKFDEAEHPRRLQPALLPVRLTEVSQHGEPITVLLRTGHMLKVSHGFDEDAFARVVALLEAT